MVSALTGSGIDRLIEVIRTRARENGETMLLEVPHEATKVIAQLHDIAEVFEQTTGDHGVIFKVWVPKNAVHLFTPYLADRLLESARVS